MIVILCEVRLEKETAPDIMSYNACLSACADAGQWAHALELHQLMLQGSNA